MASTGLFEILGIDPDDPEVIAASDDAARYERLIDCLVEARNRIGLSQKAVAERMRTTQSAVSDIERLGGSARFTTLQRFARAIGGHLSTRLVMDEWSTAIRTRAAVSRTWDADDEGTDGEQTVLRPRLIRVA